MSQLKARLFGEFEVLGRGAEPLKFRTVKVEALLAYLIVEQTPVRRELLCNLLWPGLPEQSAQANLRQTLYLARKPLRSVFDRPILSAQGTLSLNADLPLWVDVHAFDEFLAETHTHDHLDIRSCSSCQERLEQAIALATGPLLADLYLDDSNEFEDWAAERRSFYERRLFDAESTLTTICLQQGAFADAEQISRRQLARDDLREVAYQQLMRALAGSGRREAALAVFDECRSRLQDMLGMGPSKRTSELAEQIATGALQLTPVQTPQVRGYQLQQPIGSGAYGEVYRAYQAQVGREVAIKVIKQAHADKPHFIRRFEVEAQTVAQLEHPYIVPLYDYWRDADGAFLVMRLMRGGNLQRLLSHGQPWPVARVIQLVEQIGSALGQAHRQGVVHRDLKPANILLDENGNGYLGDFGIARHILEEDKGATAILSGSPYYTSPEQLRGEPVTAQSDIYTFALLVYELLSGRKPFAGVSLGQVVQQHLSGSLPSVHAVRPELPAAVDEVLTQATARDPKRRHGSVEDFLGELKRVLAYSEQGVPIKQIEGNPYKGLRAFQESDADRFFGREELVGQLLDKLTESRFVAVVGPSGSGKSSVVKAGLLPQIRSGAIEGSHSWFVAEMVPGSHPLEELEAALLRVAVDPPASLLEPLERDERGLTRVLKRILPHDEDGTPGALLLIVDQFEELFTLVEDDARRRLFLDNLLTALSEPRCRLHVVATLRADFYDRPLQQAELAQLVKQHTVVVTALSGGQLEQAIVQPARLAGRTFEDGLVLRILDDIHDQPAILPLLQYALTELYERRDGDLLTHTAYAELGGIQGVLGRRAEEIYDELNADEQAQTRQLFLRLVTLGEGVEDTRRRVQIAEVEAIGPAGDTPAPATGHPDVTPQSKIIERFASARLLTFDRDPVTRQPTIEVAHEALLREWPRLRGWLEESREDVRLQRRLALGAREWHSAREDRGYLLGGSQLDLFRNWAAETTVALTGTEAAFLQASKDAREARLATEEVRRAQELQLAQSLAEEQRQRAEEQSQAAANLRRRAVLLTGAVGLALLLAVVAVLFGRQAGFNAELAATREAEAVVAQQLAEAEADTRATAEAGALVAQQSALAEADSRATAEAEALLAQQEAEVEAQTRATAEVQAVEQAELALLAQQEAEEQTTLTRSRELALAALVNLDFDAELSILLALEGLKTWPTIEAVEALHQAVQRSRLLLRLDKPDDAFFSEVDYSPDGTQIAGVSWHEGEDGNPGKLYVWDAESGERLLTTDLGAEGNRLDYSPDGSEIAVALEWRESGDLLKIFDAETGELKRSFDIVPRGLVRRAEDDLSGNPNPHVMSVQYSPDGKHLATSHYNMETVDAAVWDAESGDLLFELTGFGNYSGDGRYRVWQNSPNYSPDGRYIAGGGAGLSAIVWDASTGEVVLTVLNESADGRPGPVLDVAFLNGSEQLLVVGGNATMRVWDIDSGELVADYDPGSTPEDANVNAEQTLIAYGTDSGNIRLLSSDLQEVVMEISAGDRNHAPAPHFNPQGTRLVDSEPNSLLVWDITEEREIRTLTPDKPTMSGTYSPDGSRLASVGWFGKIDIWDAESGERLMSIDSEIAASVDIAYSPDGTQFVTSSQNGGANLWDAATGELVRSLGGTSMPLTGTNFTPDGGLLVGLGERTLYVWNRESGALLKTVDLPANPWDVAFSPDGERAAVSFSMFDAMVNQPRLYYTTSWEEIGVMESGGIGISWAHFTRDGRRIVGTAMQTGDIFVWDAASGAELKRIDTGHGIRTSQLLADDRHIVIGTTSGTTEIWDIESARRVQRLTNAGESRQIIAVRPDEKQIASINLFDGKIRILTPDVDELIGIAESRLTRGFTESECQQYRVEPCLGGRMAAP